MEKLFLAVIDTICAIKGNETLEFPDPITVPLSGCDFDVLEIAGASVSPKGELFIMTIIDGYGYPQPRWDKLEMSDERAGKVIEAVNVRLEKTFGKMRKEVLAV